MSLRSFLARQPQRLLASFGLLQSAAQDWDKGCVTFGLLLSGEKLIDREDFRDQLLAFEPEAIGGEMEAVGLLSAAARGNTDWVVVKACCDFADGNKSTNKTENQKRAASAAAGFVHFALNLEGRRSRRPGNGPHVPAAVVQRDLRLGTSATPALPASPGGSTERWDTLSAMASCHEKGQSCGWPGWSGLGR